MCHIDLTDNKDNFHRKLCRHSIRHADQEDIAQYAREKKLKFMKKRHLCPSVGLFTIRLKVGHLHMAQLSHLQCR